MKDEEGAMTFVEEARGYMRAWLNSAHNMELVSYLNTACNTIETLERELAEARSLRAVADSNAAAARAELNAARQACNDEHPEVGQVYADLAAERIENAHLREAFVVMERAYNTAEKELAALNEKRCETCLHQRKDDSCGRLEMADYDDAHFRGSRNYHDCDDMKRTCGADTEGRA